MRRGRTTAAAETLEPPANHIDQEDSYRYKFGFELRWKIYAWGGVIYGHDDKLPGFIMNPGFHMCDLYFRQELMSQCR